MKTGTDIIAGIRKRNPSIPQNAEVGVFGSFGLDMTLKEHARGRDLTIVVNTDDLDSDGEVVEPKGIDTTYFDGNRRRIFADHTYSLMDVVGHARDPGLIAYPGTQNQRGWKAVIGLMRNPLADAAVEIARETGSIGASVGFRVRTYRRPTEDDVRRYSRKGVAPDRIIDRWDMVEISLTAMPANVSCQGRMMTDEKRLDDIDRLIVKGRIKREHAAMLGFPDKSASPKPLRVLVAS